MSGLSFDPDAIRALAKILRETDLTEIELVHNESRVRVARNVPVQQVVQTVAAPMPSSVQDPVPTVPTTASEEVTAATPGAVTSPMVGVAYLAPEPGATPFITLGARIVQGQTVLLIEAMKTFNQIKAPRAGTITRILIESGTPVEFGEPLLVIE